VEAPPAAHKDLQVFVAQAPGSPERAGFARDGVETLLPVPAVDTNSAIAAKAS